MKRVRKEKARGQLDRDEDGECEKEVQGLQGKGKNEKTRPKEEKRRGGQSVAGEKEQRRHEEKRCREMDRKREEQRGEMRRRPKRGS